MSTKRRAAATKRGGASRPALRRLADRVGIIDEYVDQTGKERRRTSDATREALLTALGFRVGSEAEARDAIRAMDEEADARLIPAVRVSSAARLAAEGIVLRAPRKGSPSWHVTVMLEDGATRELEGRTRRAGGELRIALPDDLPIGYHSMELALEGGEGGVVRQSLIVVPERCPSAETVLHGERAFGVTANLYTVRSARNWGVGDCTDLATLLEWTASVGGAFVGVNPLHALRNRAGDISPYSPVSRIFRNPLYLDVEAVPEFATSEEARERCASRETRAALAALREASRLDYEAVMRLKMPALETLHRAFAAQHRGRETSRGKAYAAYLAELGQPLDDYATFCVLEEQFASRASSWRDWPAPYRDARSGAVAEFRRRHAEQVDLHRWLQFEIDRQLAEAARRGRGAGLPIGLYVDLAIGTSPAGSDVWIEPELFVDGVTIGAPPDPYSATGQNWGLPPIDPRRLEADGYAYWVRLVRASLRHGGALRIDHVMGLFQQFWIPEGKDGKDGAYVRFPSEALLGILALEATRAGAVVVGEDLGTVPKDVPPAMERWGLLSSKVLYFERTKDGGFRRSREYAPMALATANTHDMPTLAGFWEGSDVALRREAGLIPNAKAEKAERRARERDREALVERLQAEGVMAEGEVPERDVALRAAVHAFLRRTPAWLVGLSLDDIVGEDEPVNLPGVGPDRFPSWTRRLAMPLERLRHDADVRRALGVERWWAGGSTGLRATGAAE